ncbi:MAG: diguanylate cyclase, partial [Comamonas sp.]
LAWWPGPLVRSWGLVAVASLLLACMLCLGLLAHYSDADTLRDERRQQEMVAGFTARTLGMRIDTYQRVLQSMGQGIHSSMLDTPYLLELLLREDAGYAGIFDTLVMTGSDGSMVSYAPSGGTPAGGSALRDALRRTLSDGKPQVSQITVEGALEGASSQLGLVLTVPLRQAGGAVRGALAGLVRMGLPGLLPQPEEAVPSQRWLLVDQDGLLLADSRSQPSVPTDLAAGRVQTALGVSDAQWAALSSSSTANADSQQWGRLLVTRVGLPLPRWQVVAVRDLSTRLLGMQRLTPWQWLALVATAVAVALALLGLLWWLSRPLVGLLRQGTRRRAGAQPLRPLVGAALAGSPGGRVPASAVPASAFTPEALSPLAADEATHLREHWQALEQDLHHSQQQAGSMEAAVVQLLEAMPGGTVWEQDERLLYVSRRAAALLGRDVKSLQGAHLHQLLHNQPGARQWVERVIGSLTSFGHFQGEVPWKLQPGLTRWLQVQGQCMQLPAPGNLWLLHDAEDARQHRRLARWQDAHDAATGLANQYTLQAQLQSWCAATPAQVHQAHQGQGLLWLDVDYFTALNATAGRAAGDEVLRQVAWLLQREQGAHGLAARVGADAFVLWLHPADSEAAVHTLAWRLCAAVQEWAPRYGGQRFVLGLSVGWLWTDASELDADQLLRSAEAACREAKRSGQGRAVQAKLPDVHRQ